MGDFYNKGAKFDTGLVKNIGATKAMSGAKAGEIAGDAMFKLGEIKQDKNDRTAKLNLEKSAKLKTAKDKADKISAFKKVHPKTTAGLTDDEVYALGDNITKINNDPSKWKFNHSWTAENGHKVSSYTNGDTDKDGKPVYKTVDHGKTKDYNKSSSSSDEPARDVNEEMNNRYENLSPELKQKVASRINKDNGTTRKNLKTYDSDVEIPNVKTKQAPTNTVKKKPIGKNTVKKKQKKVSPSFQLGKTATGREKTLGEAFRARMGLNY